MRALTAKATELGEGTGFAAGLWALWLLWSRNMIWALSKSNLLIHDCLPQSRKIVDRHWYISSRDYASTFKGQFIRIHTWRRCDLAIIIVFYAYYRLTSWQCLCKLERAAPAQSSSTKNGWLWALRWPPSVPSTSVWDGGYFKRFSDPYQHFWGARTSRSLGKPLLTLVRYQTARTGRPYASQQADSIISTIVSCVRTHRIQSEVCKAAAVTK